MHIVSVQSQCFERFIYIIALNCVELMGIQLSHVTIETYPVRT